MVLYAVGRVVYADPGGGHGGQGQCEEASSYFVRPTSVAAPSAITGEKEIVFSLSCRWVMCGIADNSGSRTGDDLEQATAEEAEPMGRAAC